MVKAEGVEDNHVQRQFHRIDDLPELLEYLNPKDGLVTCDGIICKCCSKMFSVSEFKTHAGFNQSHPFLYLFIESDEYETRGKKNGTLILQDDENDQNDDSFRFCDDRSELICFVKCPSAFHQACLFTQDLHEGSWYCTNCTCQICSNLVNGAKASYVDALKYLQCKHKYHEACLKGVKIYEQAVSVTQIYGGSCLEVVSIDLPSA
ncbi:Acyl-CoA N-acyltransferase with RING/FYVE/PHD-type zinc finger protein putative isoform 4 [Tripterygium wilfordii]|uniref:Acyl-CoA N-acyltransferase with RING/FYVE/PHD-type zinc finger protein putative isoform 4 n=1 Tax=Tripterygium wilfordii TaxID=458696 RepID=A0A7J7C286_TRIWF|nr:increased DNA methylation 1 isoform X2 [Tripterygium wilfordii]KAF5728279.1 Acyl-CoA N-acyltransferase with RING/FYVE/PHD-type zinc finger protein putative isoform 4 [Tripterygium wilfordii]